MAQGVYVVQMSEIVDTLRRELGALEADLENDPRYRKIAGIKALLSEYEQAQTVNVARRSGQATKRSRAVPVDSKKHRIHDVVHEMFIVSGKVHRVDILTELQSKGLLGTESNPMAALAAYLSSFDDFQSLGGGVWALKEYNDPVTSSVETEEVT